MVEAILVVEVVEATWEILDEAGLVVVESLIKVVALVAEG